MTPTSPTFVADRRRAQRIAERLRPLLDRTAERLIADGYLIRALDCETLSHRLGHIADRSKAERLSDQLDRTVDRLGVDGLVANALGDRDRSAALYQREVRVAAINAAVRSRWAVLR